jgi:hypothetical protein
MPAQLTTQRQPLTVPRTWQRGHNALGPVPEVRMPEPAKLYGLIVLAFMLHVPAVERGEPEQCSNCAQAWPCEHLRLAFRLRESF